MLSKKRKKGKRNRVGFDVRDELGIDGIPTKKQLLKLKHQIDNEIDLLFIKLDDFYIKNRVEVDKSSMLVSGGIKPIKVNLFSWADYPDDKKLIDEMDLLMDRSEAVTNELLKYYYADYYTILKNRKVTNIYEALKTEACF